MIRNDFLEKKPSSVKTMSWFKTCNMIMNSSLVFHNEEDHEIQDCL